MSKLTENQKWLETAMDIQSEILPDNEELSVGQTRQKSPDSAFIMAEYIYRHIVENSGNSAEFKNMLKELEIFDRSDKIRAIGFFYENMEMNGSNGNGCSVEELKELAKEWKLGDKFDVLMKAFFTGASSENEEDIEEVITVPKMLRK